MAKYIHPLRQRAVSNALTYLQPGTYRAIRKKGEAIQFAEENFAEMGTALVGAGRLISGSYAAGTRKTRWIHHNCDVCSACAPSKSR